MYQAILETVFWLSAGVVFCAYVVYPALIWLLSRIFGAPNSDPCATRDDQLPLVSLLISAHNEERCIAQRIENALASDYPPDKLQIIIGSDGSTDRTNEIVRGFARSNVQLLDYEVRRGKAATLNASISEINGGILVLSDANTMFEPGALRQLVCWFAHPSVGVVCGKLVLSDSKTGRNVDGIYWKYETFLKLCEGRLGGLLGANGAIYAMRRELYCPIPDNTIIDDFVIPLLAKLKHHFHIVYDPAAIAHEETAPAIGHEFRRRVRIGSGDYQSLILLWPLLNPRHGWTTFTFLGHKLIRWASPLFLLTAAVANLFLLSSPLYVATLMAQVGFYMVALLGVWFPGDHYLLKGARGVSLFCTVNAALMMGFFRWATSSQSGVWQRTERETDLA